MATPEVKIVPYAALQHSVRVKSALNEIFFEASATKTFGSDAARAAFHDLWLGAYLRETPELAYVAMAQAGDVLGYVIGSHRDPARSARAGTLTYFADFASLTARFPAELHINLAGSARGQGIGSKLISAFIHDAAHAGVPGVHVVTGAASRNVSFYTRNGFEQRASTLYKGAELLLLARETTLHRG
jgi:GNAT superfamily N-acetyltransferase